MNLKLPRQKGFILLTSFLLVSLLSLLILSQLELVFLYFKSLNRFLVKQQLFHRLEAEANKLIVNKVWVNKPCVREKTDYSILLYALKNKQGCSCTKKKQQFFYWVEDLGVFPCLQIVSGGKTQSSRHWRLSLLAWDEKPALLQLRITEPFPFLPCENRTPLKINPGLSAWYYQSRV